MKDRGRGWKDGEFGGVMGEGLFLKWGKVLRTYSVNGKAVGGRGGGTFCLFACSSV